MTVFTDKLGICTMRAEKRGENRGKKCTMILKFKLIFRDVFGINDVSKNIKR